MYFQIKLISASIQVLQPVYYMHLPARRLLLLQYPL